jgi:hypothetical protein
MFTKLSPAARDELVGLAYAVIMPSLYWLFAGPLTLPEQVQFGLVESVIGVLLLEPANGESRRRDRDPGA